MNLIVTQRMAALAALLALALMPACGLRSTNSSTETLTVYQDAPNMKLLDLGAGEQPGRRVSFFCSATLQPRRSGDGRSIWLKDVGQARD